jgi:hypothetical protein
VCNREQFEAECRAFFETILNIGSVEINCST